MQHHCRRNLITFARTPQTPGLQEGSIDMHYYRTNGRDSGIQPILGLIRRLATAAAVALFLSLAVLPAYAHDDDGAALPPSAQAQETAARATIAVLSLVTGVAVYYVMQRKRLTDSGKHA